MSLKIVLFEEVPDDTLVDYLVSRGMTREVAWWRYCDPYVKAKGERGVAAVDDQGRMFALIGHVMFQRRQDGRLINTPWIVDWSKREDSPKGTGQRVLHGSIDHFGFVAGGIGSAISQHIFPPIANSAQADAYRMLWRPLRLGFAIDRIASRLPGWSRRIATAFEDLPIPRVPTLRRRRATITRGVAPEIAPLLERDDDGVGPEYDLPYLEWQIARCPDLECVSFVAGRAAVLAWHPPGAVRMVRAAVFVGPDADADLDVAVRTALGELRGRGAHSLAILADGAASPLGDRLRRHGFLSSRGRMPLWFFRTKPTTVVDPPWSGLSFLDGDLGYRF